MFETMDIPEKPTLYPVIMPNEELKKKSSEIDLWKLIKPRYKPFYTRGLTHSFTVATSVLTLKGRSFTCQ